MKDCCNIKFNENIKKKSLKCKRKSDNKIFEIPRKFTRKRCITGKVKGFTMRSSCAPYKYCGKQQLGGKSRKKQFLFNPKNPKKSFDVYIDKDPSDTIPIKYKTYEDVKNTINKLERLYKNNKYSHKRIWQVGMIMMVRLRVLKDKKERQYKLAKKYFDFLGKRTKIKNKADRKKLTFKI